LETRNDLQATAAQTKVCSETITKSKHHIYVNIRKGQNISMTL